MIAQNTLGERLRTSEGFERLRGEESCARDHRSSLSLQQISLRCCECDLRLPEIARDFSEHFEGSPWCERNRVRAFDSLAADLNLAVCVYLGHNELKKLEFARAQAEISGLEDKMESFGRVRAILSAIFVSAAVSEVMAKIAERSASHDLGDVIKELVQHPETFAPLNGTEIPEGQAPPRGFEPLELDWDRRDSFERQLGRKVARLGMDRMRIAAVKTLIGISLALNDTDSNISALADDWNLASYWLRAGSLIGQYLSDPASLDSKVASEKCRKTTEADAIHARQKEDLGNVFYPHAVVKAMEAIRIRDAALQIPEAFQAAARLIYEKVLSGEVPPLPA